MSTWRGFYVKLGTMTRSLIAGTVLVAAFLALVVVEQDRPWKRLQAEHRELELSRLRAEREALTRRLESSRDLASRQLDDARQRLAGRLEEEQRLQDELRSARHGRNWSAEDLRRQEARQDSVSLNPEIRAARRKFEEYSKSTLDLERRLTRLRSEVATAEARWSLEVEPIRALDERTQILERGFVWQAIPGLRGLDPSLTVREIRPPGLFRQTPMGLEPRVDRCTTCHLAAHPGTLVTEMGPHPAPLFGCTICHGGHGGATDFSRAGHWPSGTEQEDEWARQWGFSRKELPSELILPVAMVSSGCITCHEGAPHEGDPKTGQRLIRRMGCAGCHDVPPTDMTVASGATVESSGPPLGRLAAKTTREWAFHWIRAPRAFRSTTWMPHLFNQGTEREVAVIRAIVHTLWSPSEPSLSEPSPSEGGNAETGRKLFNSIGCTGCHLLDEDAVRHQVPLERLHGPNLARIGNKVNASWLQAWLRDPRSHRPDTAMPNLRLTRAEVSDLVAFLMAERDPAWGELEIPSVDMAVRDRLVLEYLEGEMSLDDSAARLAEMNSSDKDLYLGQHSLRAHGCLGCHAVPGLEREAPHPGDSLARLHREPARLLAGPSEVVLAHRPIPGGVDVGKPRPNYNLSSTEADAILVHLLAAPAHEVAPGLQAEKRDRTAAARRPVEVEGRRLLEHYNCLGCHSYEGRGQTTVQAAGQASPPDLTSAGARFVSSWLFGYLPDPGSHRRRPWLSVRMPTFNFDPEEVHSLVRFFAVRDDEPLLMAPFPRPDKRHVSVGRAVATMLQCDRCHQDSPDVESLAPEQLSPSYGGARSRLRPDWVAEWILDPQGYIAGTGMPATFAKNEEGAPDGSYLTALIGAPMFQIHRARLLPLFDSEDDLLAYLSDSGQVARALRDYLWSLEE